MMEKRVVHHRRARSGKDQQAAGRQLMIEKALQPARQRGIDRHEIRELVDAHGPRLRLQRQDLEKLGPGFRHDLSRQAGPEILDDLLELDLRGCLNGLRVGAPVRPQPLPHQPRLADAASSEQDEQPTGTRRGVELAQLALPVDEQVHCDSITSIMMLFNNYVL